MKLEQAGLLLSWISFSTIVVGWTLQKNDAKGWAGGRRGPWRGLGILDIFSQVVARGVIRVFYFIFIFFGW